MRKLLSCIILFGVPFSYAAQLAIIIDDYGYRLKNELAILTLSKQITIAVLPDSPNAKLVAERAYQNGNDVILHLPMAPQGVQSLEKNTLYPNMTEEQIERIIQDAVSKVPHVIGLNNHMGSLMTSDRVGMEKIMKVLVKTPFFFLDSRTIAYSQALKVAQEYRIPSLARDIFLDDTQTIEEITHQFDRAVQIARKNGFAVVIGHPYSPTVEALKQKMTALPDDIELVKLSQLISEQNKRITLGEIIESLKEQLDKTIFNTMKLHDTNAVNSQ